MRNGRKMNADKERPGEERSRGEDEKNRKGVDEEM